MIRCEHGQKITKFCITEHCHHKEAAGCQYCIRKYHFHLNNTKIITETDIDNLIKNLTLPTDIKFKSRSLQQASIDYLRSLKISFNDWIDQAQNEVADRLGHPSLHKKGFLNTYTKIKQKQYRKINAKQLRMIDQFSSSVTPDSLKKQEIINYYEEVDWTINILSAVENVLDQIKKLPEIKKGQGKTKFINKNKLKQIYESIKNQIERRNNSSKKGGIQSSINKQEDKNIGMTDITQNSQNHSPQNTKEKKLIQSAHHNDKTTDQTQKFAQLQKQSIVFQSPTYNVTAQTKEQNKRSLRRRRSSIDDKLDLKFGINHQDKLKQAKIKQQNDQRKLQKIEQQISEPEEWSQQTNTLKNQEQKSPQTINGNKSIIEKLLKPELKSSDKIQKNQSNDKQSNNKRINNKVQKYQTQQDNYQDLLNLPINNILPPLPSLTPTTHTQQSIKQRVVKIPIPNNCEDEALSPILKNRKRQNDKNSNQLQIILMPINDKIIENKDQVSNPTDQYNKDQKLEKINQNIKEQVLEKNHQNQDDLIILEKNQKYSLLLFCQALRSPPNQAIDMLRAALKYSPQNLSAAQYLSYLYLEDGKSKQCLEVCDLILFRIKDTPRQYELTLHLHNNKSAALNQLGRYSQSILILQKCLRFRRKSYLYKNLGDAYFCLGIHQKAAINYQKAIKLDPQGDEAFYNLAVTYFFQQQYTSAQINIKQALKKQPQNQIYNQLADQISKRISNRLL